MSEIDKAANKVLTSFGKYRYNEFEVCLNPSSVLLNVGKVFSYEIDVAEHEYGWTSGYRYELAYEPAWSISSGPASTHDRYSTKEAAIIESATHVLESLTEKIHLHKKLQKHEKELQPLKDLLSSFPNNKQLKMAEFKPVPIADIKPDPNQPRKFYDETAMQELTDSIKAKGILQPILIRPNGKGYILVCGERRFRAATAAQLKEVPAVIRELTDEEALELQIIENLQRKDVHPMEEAVAFKSLLERKENPLSIDDVAARVGKTGYFVKQRMKLNALSKEWQDIFYKNKIQIAMALAIALLADKEQAELYSSTVEKKYLNDPTYYPRIDSWNLDKLRRSLNKAPFDTKDATLNPKMGACTGCVFNTAVASLFPDSAKDPICNNGGCFKIKSDTAFASKLKEVQEDPSVLLVYNYCRSNDDQKLVEKLSKEHKIYRTGYGEDVQVEHSPNKKDIEAGKVLKAFYVAGEERGRVVYVRKSNSKSSSSKSGPKAADKIKEGKATTADVDAEIRRLQENEKRAKELDGIKIHKNILGVLEKDYPFQSANVKWQPIDRGFMVYLLLNSGDYRFHEAVNKMKFLPKKPSGHGYTPEYFTQLSKITDDQLAMVVRALAKNKHGNANLVYSITHDDTILYTMAQYSGVDVKGITQAQNEVAARRIERVNKRLGQLKETRKSLQQPSSATKKAAPAKNSSPAKKAAKKK